MYAQTITWVAGSSVKGSVCTGAVGSSGKGSRKHVTVGGPDCAFLGAGDGAKVGVVLVEVAEMKGCGNWSQHIRVHLKLCDGRCGVVRIPSIPHPPLAAKAAHCPGLITSDSPVQFHPWEAAGRTAPHTAAANSSTAAASLIACLCLFRIEAMQATCHYVSFGPIAAYACMLCDLRSRQGLYT